MWMTVTTPAGTISSRNTTPTIQNISRWWRGPSDQKSIRITRMPFSPWKSTAAIRPYSITPTIGIW